MSATGGSRLFALCNVLLGALVIITSGAFWIPSRVIWERKRQSP